MIGIAYLSDGTRIDYKEYIRSHPHWQKVRRVRYEFDSGLCAFCHRDLTGEPYETHHLSYARLGHERMRDVITLCGACHDAFHQNWTKQQFWRGKEKGHWDVYSLEHTARLCAMYWQQDRLICKDPDAPNMCSVKTAEQFIDDYYRDTGTTANPIIDPNDISLFVRNKRYELWFEAEERGLSREEFLDEYYGPKIRGKSPIRTEAGKKNGTFDHDAKSFRRHYSENKNINILMEEVRKYEARYQRQFQGDYGQAPD